MDIKYLYENTELTLQQIANQLNLTVSQVWWYVSRNYSSQYRKDRKTVCYRNSKLGNKNPMQGKVVDKHHAYKGNVSDGKGYLMHIKPSWYTGRKGCKHVFTHHLVVCEGLNLTQIPKGWVVHHCDFNPHNNSFDNLVLLKMGDHTRLHKYLNGATTISKESTLKWVEMHGTPFRSDDIVSSAQECAAAKAAKEVTSLCEDK
jgi:hypothetical protein